MFNSLTQKPWDSMHMNEHVKSFRWHWYMQGVEIDRYDNYQTVKGEKISVEKNDYLSHGIMPRGCEDMLWEAVIGDYDLGSKIGRGRTKLAAIGDLMEQLGY